jgi:tetratricopeptide (TPR) repeat protein
LEPRQGPLGGRRWPWVLGLLVMGLLAVGVWSGRQASPAASERAAWLQPLDAGLQGQRLQAGRPVHAWSDWSGRAQPEWLHARSVVAAQQGRLDEALEWAQKAVSRQPFWAPGWQHLGLLLQAAGRLEDAEAMMARALDLEPHFARVLAWSCDRALERGETAQAQAYLRRILVGQQRLPDGLPQDPYSRFILEVDPAWLEARNKMPELSTVFERRN